MDENILKSAGWDENAKNKVAPSTASELPPESQVSDSKLRVVWCDSKLRDLWSSKLGLSEEVADDCARTGAEPITASSTDTAQDASGEAGPGPAAPARSGICPAVRPACRARARRMPCRRRPARASSRLPCRPAGQRLLAPVRRSCAYGKKMLGTELSYD
jgi:hypothetical protein